MLMGHTCKRTFYDDKETTHKTDYSHITKIIADPNCICLPYNIRYYLHMHLMPSGILSAYVFHSIRDPFYIPIPNERHVPLPAFFLIKSTLL